MKFCIDPKDATRTDEGLTAMSGSHDWKVLKVDDYANGLLERDKCSRCGLDRVCIIAHNDSY